MSLEEIAKLIPDEFRKMILEENVIYKAVAVGSDAHMKILFTIWTTYVSSVGMDLSCGYCLQECLSNFKTLQPVLIRKEQEAKMLDL